MKFPRPIFTLTIAAAILLTALNPHAFAARRPQPAGTGEASARTRPRNLVDINHASLEELKTLPGIQEALAQKIIRNRPYANKTQLSSRGIVPAATYRRIRPLIIAKQ